MTPQEIVRALEARGMTRHQIAKSIGVTQSSIWRIAAGVTTGPKYWVMDSLRLLLGGEGMSGDHNMHQKPRSYLDDFECPRCGHCCQQQTEQEPVAWMYVNDDGECEQIEYGPVFDDPGVTPLYNAPPKKEWVGLTVDEIWKCNKASGSAVEFHICYEHQNVEDFAESIEAKLREKNHG